MPTKEINSSLQSQIKLLRDDFKDFVRRFEIQVMPRPEAELRLAELNKDIAQIKLEIVDHKKESQVRYRELEAQIRRRTWITHTLTAAFTALLTLAIAYIFNDITRG